MRWLTMMAVVLVGCGEGSGDGRGGRSGRGADDAVSAVETGAGVGEACEEWADCASGLMCAPQDCFEYECAEYVCQPSCETIDDCEDWECCVLLDTEEPAACMEFNDSLHSGGLYVCPN